MQLEGRNSATVSLTFSSAVSQHRSGQKQQDESHSCGCCRERGGGGGGGVSKGGQQVVLNRIALTVQERASFPFDWRDKAVKLHLGTE